MTMEFRVGDRVKYCPPKTEINKRDLYGLLGVVGTVYETNNIRQDVTVFYIDEKSGDKFRNFPQSKTKFLVKVYEKHIDNIKEYLEVIV